MAEQLITLDPTLTPARGPLRAERYRLIQDL